ncbi:hypothetical protein HHK36_028497 [Tetracentron sinense]|uniref:Uncharacterized protein n=1 Tax=Tetracentron sinense TaxID=13715 RepID=A0A834YF50_TETSI|nr:hypothetical protein HHK36_028497 [Tetracentron sinense]
MAFYEDEEEIWKCRRHPSKHRRTGVCPICLRDRLISLCPYCANVRPCACCPTSSSSSSSSSFSLSSTDVPKSSSGIGSVGRVSNLIDSEPAFRRSRSAAFQFLRPISVDKDAGFRLPPPGNRRKSLFGSVFKGRKEEEEKKDEEVKKMVRSKSVGISGYSDSGGEIRNKGWGWYFPSPIKIFRHPKTAKVLQER